MSALIDKLAAELKRDWRRTGLLVGLVVVAAVLMIRQFSGAGASPAEATPGDAGVSQPAGQGNGPAVGPGGAVRSDAVRRFSGPPDRGTTNAVGHSSAGGGSVGAGDGAVAPARGTGDANSSARNGSHERDSSKVFRFSSDVSTMDMPKRDPFMVKLDDFQADPTTPVRSKTESLAGPVDDPEGAHQRRLAQEAAIRTEAQKLHVQSILMANPRRAMIGKDIFTVGQRVGPFLLTQIEADRVTMEKDGFEVMLKLESSSGR